MPTRCSRRRMRSFTGRRGREGIGWPEFWGDYMSGKSRKESSKREAQNTAFAEIEVSGYEQVAPTPDILDALVRDYPIEASIADLVDNSIDAKARNVLIRFVRDGRKLLSLCVADDGWGIK